MLQAISKKEIKFQFKVLLTEEFKTPFDLNIWPFLIIFSISLYSIYFEGDFAYVSNALVENLAPSAFNLFGTLGLFFFILTAVFPLNTRISNTGKWFCHAGGGIGFVTVSILAATMIRFPPPTFRLTFYVTFLFVMLLLLSFLLWYLGELLGLEGFLEAVSYIDPRIRYAISIVFLPLLFLCWHFFAVAGSVIQ